MASSWKEIEEALEAGTSFLSKEILPFIKLAAKDEKLGSLFPYSSHQALGFSKVKEYPHTKGLPFIVFDGTLKAVTAKNETLASGTEQELLDFCRAVV